MSNKLSILIPSRNEQFLPDTVIDVFNHAHGPIEVIVCLEGYWPPAWAEFSAKFGDRLITIHSAQPKGMRGAINACVDVSRGDYLLKTDAHCSFAPGFDVVLKNACQPHMIVVPRRYRLDADKWETIEDGRAPIDYEYIGFPDLGGRKWTERALERANVLIDDCPTFQGSCWLMQRDYFDFLELMDAETYGSFFHEAQEMSLKAWLSGGHVRVVKTTSYAHLHKSKEMGRGYKLESGLREHAVNGLRPWLTGQGWHKQTRSLESLIAQFRMPSWPEDWQQQIAAEDQMNPSITLRRRFRGTNKSDLLGSFSQDSNAVWLGDNADKVQI